MFNSNVSLNSSQNISASLDELENQEFSPELMDLISAIENDDIRAFSENIKNIDLNAYCNFEGISTLTSAFLLGVSINPDVMIGDRFIQEILAQQPDFELPIYENESLRCSDVLKSIHQSLIDERAVCSADMVEFFDIVLSRIELVVDR